MLSSANINAALTRTMKDSFIDTIRRAGEEVEKWEERGDKLATLSKRGKEMAHECTEKDGLLYDKNRLYMLEDKSLQTEIAQGGHDSVVAVLGGSVSVRNCNTWDVNHFISENSLRRQE